MPFCDINGLRQGAWRYFADKSDGGNTWHLHTMTGTPFKNKLTKDELYSIELVRKRTVVVTPQAVSYNRWLRLDRDHQIKHMKLFLENPVEASDYILQDTFHCLER